MIKNFLIISAPWSECKQNNTAELLYSFQLKIAFEINFELFLELREGVLSGHKDLVNDKKCCNYSKSPTYLGSFITTLHTPAAIIRAIK